MKIPIYIVDAFAEKPFEGNPAAICPLDAWLDDTLMQNIAAENNLSETAFFVPYQDHYHIRWFTPTTEVNLCGHATLASAFIVFEKLGLPGDEISFHSRSGKLSVKRQQDRLTLNFPVQTLQPAPAFRKDLAAALQTEIVDAFSGEDLIAVVSSEEDVLNCKPNLALITQLPFRGVIITAAGKQKDFVCRFFGPRTGVNEDPVTGSAYTELMPYWSNMLKKKQLTARQLSARGGNVECCLVDNNRVLISGYARLYLEGFLLIE